MKVLLTIWILVVLIQEVVPSTLVRLPRHALNHSSLVHTEYEAKYEQKGKHGNESVSTVSGKQQIVHDNCSENWNAFAEKCASLIKDLVASLANAVHSNPGEATKMQLHIKNTFKHFDNTHNCTCLNHTGKGLSDLDLTPFFNNITINTVTPKDVNGDGSGKTEKHCGDGQSCDGGKTSDTASGSHLQNGEPHHKELGSEKLEKCQGSDGSCSEHDHTESHAGEAVTPVVLIEAPQNKKKLNGLSDAGFSDVNPSNAAGSDDDSTNNSRRQVDYPRVSKQPNLSKTSAIPLIEDSQPSSPVSQYHKNGKKSAIPFLVTPVPSYPDKSTQVPVVIVDPISATRNSPDSQPPSALPLEDGSSGIVPPSSLNKGQGTPSSASHLLTPLPNGNLNSNNKNALPEDFSSNLFGTVQQPTPIESAPAVVLPVKPVHQNKSPSEADSDSHISEPVVINPLESITPTQKLNPPITVPGLSATTNDDPESTSTFIQPEGSVQNSKPSAGASLGPVTLSPEPLVTVPVKPVESGGDSAPSLAVPLEEKPTATAIPIINSNSNLPDSSDANCDEETSSPSPSYEPVHEGLILTPSSNAPIKDKAFSFLPLPENNFSPTKTVPIVLEQPTTTCAPESKDGSELSDSEVVITPSVLEVGNQHPVNLGPLEETQVTAIPIHELSPTNERSSKDAGEKKGLLEHDDDDDNDDNDKHSDHGDHGNDAKDDLVVAPVPVKTGVEESAVVPQITSTSKDEDCEEDKDSKNKTPTASTIPVILDSGIAENNPLNGLKENESGLGHEAFPTTPVFVYPVKPIPEASLVNEQSQLGNDGSLSQLGPLVDGNENEPFIGQQVTTPIPVLPVKLVTEGVADKENDRDTTTFAPVLGGSDVDLTNQQQNPAPVIPIKTLWESTTPAVVSNGDKQPEHGIIPTAWDTNEPNENQSDHTGAEESVLLKPTTFQTTSVDPTPPPAPVYLSPTESTKPLTQTSVSQDSDEKLLLTPSTSPKTPKQYDEDDDDEEDCCSCESCTEEEITDPKQFKESACKNLEDARRELKIIFDKIKKKLKCGKKAPQTITTS